MDERKQLLQAKTLIQHKQYEDARALLITIDHPTAEKWLTKLNSIIASQPQLIVGGKMKHSEQPDFTVKLFITVVLLFFAIIPGIIALLIFEPQARKYPEADGARGLIMLGTFIWWGLLLMLFLLITAIILLGLADAGSADIYSLF